MQGGTSLDVGDGGCGGPVIKIEIRTDEADVLRKVW